MASVERMREARLPCPPSLGSLRACARSLSFPLFSVPFSPRWPACFGVLWPRGCLGAGLSCMSLSLPGSIDGSQVDQLSLCGPVLLSMGTFLGHFAGVTSRSSLWPREFVPLSEVWSSACHVCLLYLEIYADTLSFGWRLGKGRGPLLGCCFDFPRLRLDCHRLPWCFWPAAAAVAGL